jgi:NADH-quinone oxidoreductase subunit N
MSSSDLIASTQAILPLVILVIWACGMLLLDVFFLKKRSTITAALAALGLLVALGFVVARFGTTTSGFGGMVVADNFSNFLNILLLTSGLAGVALAFDYLKRTGVDKGEYYVLLLFAIVGMMLMGMSADLIMIFLALELLSIPV